MALHGKKDLDGAMEFYQKGLEIDPSNAQMQQGMSQILKEKRGGGGGMGGLGSMFGPEGEAKLKQNPRIAKYFEDPKFKTMWDMCSQNPQMMMQLVQQDPRFMDVFKEITGIDLMDMQEKQMKKQDDMEELKKKREQEEKVRKE
mmetsp:Transcript_7375/g.12458  ORF Transcript_7375/g.12458 Transcript_7375/m.12458 type:complete len:144 (-) Transcript_7375:1103-1534(-)